MGNLQLIGIPLGVAALFAIAGAGTLRIAALARKRSQQHGRTGTLITAVSCFVMAALWIFIASFYAITG